MRCPRHEGQRLQFKCRVSAELPVSVESLMPVPQPSFIPASRMNDYRAPPSRPVPPTRTRRPQTARTERGPRPPMLEQGFSRAPMIEQGPPAPRPRMIEQGPTAPRPRMIEQGPPRPRGQTSGKNLSSALGRKR